MSAQNAPIALTRLFHSAPHGNSKRLINDLKLPAFVQFSILIKTFFSIENAFDVMIVALFFREFFHCPFSASRPLLANSTPENRMQ